LAEPFTQEDILSIWEEMKKKAPLAVRSSMGEEDGEKESQAGKYATVLSVKTLDELKEAIVHVLSSHSGDSTKAVMIQPMIDSTVSGVMFTSSPFHSDRTTIEAVYGLGELLVSGQLTPESYEIDKNTSSVTKELNRHKYYGLFLQSNTLSLGEEKRTRFGNVRNVAHMNGNFLGSIPYKMRTSYCLTELQALYLYTLGLAIEKHFGCPQDIEWAMDDKRIYILQTRPITHSIPSTNPPSYFQPSSRRDSVLNGKKASLGMAEGNVKIIDDSFPFDPTLDEEEFILVAYETKPEYVHYMSRAKAIVTEIGGTLCHAAIVSRELGIPCLVGVEGITSLVSSGDKIVVNANEGEVILC
jgi:pyruvate,water dikinase